MDIQVVKHGAQFRDLVGLFGDFLLRNDGTLILNEGAPQLDLGTIFADGPFEDFSINGNYLQVGLFQEPCPELSIQSPRLRRIAALGGEYSRKAVRSIWYSGCSGP